MSHPFLLISLLVSATPLVAQAPTPAPVPGPVVVRISPSPAEPDYRLISLPSTLPLARGRSAFEMSHKFVGNLREGSFADQLGDLFGLDQGARVSLGYRRAIVENLQAGIARSSVDKTIQFHARWDALHQSESSPLSISALVSVEGGNNFRERRHPAVGAVVSRKVADRLALYASPIWLHHLAFINNEHRDTFMLGVGARARIGNNAYLVAELTPRVAGYSPESTAFGVGLEKRVGGHVFQLNMTNNLSATWSQIARGGLSEHLHLGFNLSRKF